MWQILGGAVAAWALLAGAARADVLVPDDPPAAARTCPAAAGDVLVAVREAPEQRWYVAVSEAGTPWRRVTPLLPPTDGDRCARVAAAPDGTAAVAAGSRLLVRPPGGSFGPPVRLGRSFSAANVAVAPGGWAAVTGERFTRDGVELAAATIPPGGTAEVAAVERAGRDATVLAPSIGIDATGTATVAWIRARWEGRATVHAARFSSGAWGPTQTIGAARQTGGDELDLAVSPAGRTLLAWPDRDGIVAAVDGSPPQRLVTERPAGYPSVTIADDGTATLAFAAGGGEVRALSRAQAGGWTPPVTLAGRSKALPPELVPDLPVASVLTAEGRALVAWQDMEGVMAAWGTAGADWTPGARVSAVTHEGRDPVVWLDAGGVPRILWAEDVPFGYAFRVRGARLVPDAEAPPPDTTAPVVTTDLPARTPRTKTAHVRFRIPVRCSEACDVRLQIVEVGSGAALETVTRTLAAGQSATLRFTTGWTFAKVLLVAKHMRRPRIEIVAADRAGNVARISRRITVRVVDRPILGYRVGPRHDFEMFTRAGNRAVGALVNDLIAGIASGAYRTERQLRRRYRDGVDAIEDAGHDEVHDTAVGDAIYTAIYVPCVRKRLDAEAIMG